MWALVKEATRETTRLIDFAKAFQNRAHERNKAEDRNFQTIWRSIRIDEEDSLSTVRLEEMARCRFRGISCRTFWRWRRFQFPIAIQKFLLQAGRGRYRPHSRAVHVSAATPRTTPPHPPSPSDPPAPMPEP